MASVTDTDGQYFSGRDGDGSRHDALIATEWGSPGRVASAATALTAVEASLSNVDNALASLGTASNALDTHLNFVSNLQDTLTTGIGNLVNADLAKESATLQALQTKQQLGIQALSIANSASSALLSLFR